MLNAVHKERFSLRARVEGALTGRFCRSISARETCLGFEESDEEEERSDWAKRNREALVIAAGIVGTAVALAPDPHEELVDRLSLAEAKATLHDGEREGIALVYEEGMKI
jgi:hypothetical protein